MYTRPPQLSGDLQTAINVGTSLFHSIFGGGGPSQETIDRHLRWEACLFQKVQQGNPVAMIYLRAFAGQASGTELQQAVQGAASVQACMPEWDATKLVSDPTYHDKSERERLGRVLALASMNGLPTPGNVTLPQGIALVGGTSFSPWLLVGIAGAAFLLLRKKR